MPPKKQEQKGASRDSSIRPPELVVGRGLSQEAKLLKEIADLILKLAGKYKTTKTSGSEDVKKNITLIEDKLREYEELQKKIVSLGNVLKPTKEEASVQNKTAGTKECCTQRPNTKPLGGATKLKDNKSDIDVDMITAEVERLMGERKKFEESLKILSDIRNLMLPQEPGIKTTEDKQNNKSRGQNKNTSDLKTKETSADDCKIVAENVQAKVKEMMKDIKETETHIQLLSEMIFGERSDTKNKKKDFGTSQAPSDKVSTLEELCRHFEKSKRKGDQITSEDAKKQVLASTNEKKVKNEHKSLSKQMDKLKEMAKKQLNEEIYKKIVKEAKGENDDQFLPNFMSGVIKEAATKAEVEQERDTLRKENMVHEKFTHHVLLTIEEACDVISRSTKKKQSKLKLVEDPGNKDISAYNAALSRLIESAQQINTDNQMIAHVNQLKEENESLQTRLSKVAGMRLTENNPSITDLSDPNRPMKVGEQYSELYDNEWTDLMDKLEAEKKKPDHEDKILQALCSTLLTCYKHCSDLDRKLQESEVMIAKTLQIDESTLMSATNIRDYRGSSLQMVEKQIQVIRTDPKIQKEFTKEIKLGKDLEKQLLSSTFFEKCFRLCWMMVIMQQPPMVIEEAERTVNREKFREYTKSGSKVLFTVWPALLLHKGGPILVKGVMKMK